MRISLELVPHSTEGLINELKLVRDEYPMIDMINIPDLARLELRSTTACQVVKQFFNDSIPHIRAIDFDLNNLEPLITTLKVTGLKEILILKGDPPQDMSKRVYTTTSINLVHRIKEAIPDIKVYGAIDQYRSSFRKEYEYIQEKLYAGMDGFFTQPFFDKRQLSLAVIVIHNLVRKVKNISKELLIISIISFWS